MKRFSVLDLAPIAEGSDAAASFRNTVDLARHAEASGYHRYWLAEHHGMPGIASAATAVLIGHVAASTRTIRVGAGGVMLPNHSPLVVAKQFATLDALHPGRIDLGLGRAPGSDPATARALRRRSTADPEAFPQDVLELLAHFDPASDLPVRAVPGAGADVPVWILGSSLYGAQLAAALGLPYAFASHFAPAQMMDAITLYRATFRPSARLAEPWVMLGFNVVAADTDEAAALLASSREQAVVAMRTGRPGRLPPPVAGYRATLDAPLRAMLDQVLSCSAVGSPATVARQLHDFLERTGADELMVTAHIFDHAARVRSQAIAAEVLRGARTGCGDRTPP